MKEAEYKYILNKIEYYQIKEDLNKQFSYSNFLQINYYFDSNKNDLHKSNITCKIRQKENILNLEIKRPIERKDYLIIKDKYNQKVNFLPKTICTRKISFLSNIQSEELYLKGMLITQRFIYQLKRTIQISLDKNYYLGIIDYELEIEFEDDSQNEAFTLFNNLKINKISQPTGGKRERFFEILEKLDVF